MPPSVASSSDATPYLRAGLVTGLAATLLGAGLCAIVAAIAAGTGGSPLTALRAGARAWLLPLGSGLQVDGTDITLIPLGGTIVVGLVVALTVRWVVDAPVDEVGPFAATVAGTAGVLAAVLSNVSDSATVSTSPVRSAFGAFVVAGVAAGLAASRGREGEPWLAGHPEVRAVLRAAVGGAATFLAACTVIVLALFASSTSRAAELWAALDPGLAGSVTLGLLCLIAMPTLVLWAGAVVLGPGVQIGTDTSLDLTGAYLGPVPGLPALAVLPEPGAFPDWVVVLGLVPLLAGVYAGWRLAVPEETAVVRRVVLGAVAGAGSGLVVGLLVQLSAGAVGPGRMGEVGPISLAPLLVAVPVLAAGGAIGAGLAHYRVVRAKQPSDPTPGTEGRRPRLGFRHQPAGADRRDQEPRPGLRGSRRLLRRPGRGGGSRS
ncbi:DUF6350 family protein [Aeromicrobium sp. CTD01-1L150]|uniref:cell division protein PerM n=1 Tax=Aeromicrobium sp. CTD01-1L150 TaxID=3341830 RepID=UPI0035C0CB57